MTTQKEMSRINRLVETIQKNGPISNIGLVMKSGISISYFEKLRPYLKEIYNHKVRYDKETKTWRSITQEELESDEV